jgi:hypothetical protein
MTHEAIVDQVRSGKIRVSVNRRMARKFFTRIPLGLIRKETGESLYFEKALIWTAYLAGPVLLAASIAAAFLAFGLWGFLFLIGGLPVYGLYSTASMRERAGLIPISLILAVTVVTHWFNAGLYTGWTKFAFLFTGALWSVRFVYAGSAGLLRLFVLRNAKAFNYLGKYLEIHER